MSTRDCIQLKFIIPAKQKTVSFKKLAPCLFDVVKQRQNKNN